MIAARRWSIVYCFNILDPVTRVVRGDYVGKSVQQLDARERQHRGPEWDTDPQEQPWSDLIVGKPFILEKGMWTAAELDAREQFWIREVKPRYNDMFNRGNPERIPRDVARAQREARDAAKGVVAASWKPSRPVVRPRPLRPIARVSGSQRKHLTAATTWAALSAASWWAATTYGGLGGWVAPLAGTLAAVVLMAAVALTAAELKRWWNSRKAKRQRRRLALTLAALTVTAAVVGLLYLTGPALLAHVPAQAR